jgi:hypothetical protein
MNKISEFITAEELCERWQTSLRDILYKTKKGKLKWYTAYTMQFNTIDDQVKAECKDDHELMDIFGKDTKFYEKLNEHKLHIKKEREQTTTKMTIEILKSEEFYFKTKEIKAYEKKMGIKLVPKKRQSKGQTNIQAKTDTTLAYLDRRHKHFAKELSIALKAWEAMFGSDGKYNTKLSVKTQIADWLNKNYPRLEKNAVKRIATVVNPNKKGGAPRTE